MRKPASGIERFYPDYSATPEEMIEADRRCTEVSKEDLKGRQPVDRTTRRRIRKAAPPKPVETDDDLPEGDDFPDDEEGCVAYFVNRQAK